MPYNAEVFPYAAEEVFLCNLLDCLVFSLPMVVVLELEIKAYPFQ